MAGQRASFEPRMILLGKENVEGAGAVPALVAASVLLTENSSAQIGVGDSRENKYDTNKAGSRNNPVETTNLQNKISFDTPFAFPAVPGTAGPLDNLLLCAGFDVVHDPIAKTSIFTPSTLSSIDTVHASMRADESGGNDIEYASKGMRGIFNLSIAIGERIKLDGINLEGSYILPDEVAHLDEDLGVQLNNLIASCNADTIDAVTLDGKAVCLESLNIGNAGGLVLTKSNMSCEDSVIADAASPEGTIIYRKPDYATEFNPFELGESHITQKSVPLVFEITSTGIGKLSITADVQPLETQRTKLKDTTSGITQKLKFLSVPTLTLSEAL